MDATAVKTGTEGKIWGGGDSQPLKASYGKMMMWFFILSDALTFSGFLAAYGFSRFKFINQWPIADEVFTHFPFLHGVDAPMYYVALMTFILIFSSVTMVLAVDAGHQMKKNKVIWYMFFTILGGFVFVGSQAWEWANFISGEYGAIETKGGKILQVVNAEGEQVALESFAVELPSDRTQLTKSEALWYESESSMPDFELAEVVEGFKANPDLLVRTQMLNEAGEKTILSREASLAKLENDAMGVVQGANLVHNEYGPPLFADFFFFITGFHGFHVFSGVIINIIIFINVILGTYERRGSYEMVEKVGLYWHFVDLVWVFVFTFFYLV
ncbi:MULTISPECIES: cytochrome c oxidase subunit 3 [Leeuwenhoekiella]|jgi:cytochrome c oxidase subunit 3|uniref:cytochrome c oxidase subunit 3 n=1 Tax=Leeuwenhoekiella TaxID=283735 RepID=UPI000C514064|nr:cytochrome c oxidase subunit 3 [Leeuwenhoekiella blandensis]MBQ51690.1 cytochrome oxidase subunit III [Leeuwenhoekiella sp.]HBT10345.1 cytochrome oxidase subunit III [Leeuwenhoekiella sp.]HCW65218.1 cytochrome oxidase subunit III [Leeuwenhoekiella sp.]|tara:strand:+ start:2661 stop:3644 length:984 start_codon:yes stop_codon:yes gene_type:complete